MGVLGQPAHVDGADPRARHAVFLPDDVGVHARTAHVLPHLIDDEAVEILERKPGQQRVGAFEQFAFRVDQRVEASDRHALDDGGLLECVLHERDGADQPRAAGFHDHAGRFEHEPAHAQTQRLVVDLRRAGLLAHADHEHLADAALHPLGEAGVRLDPIDHEHAVRVVANPVLVHREAAVGGPDLHHFHARFDGAADARLGDAVDVVEHPRLPFGRRTAVAAHRGDDDGAGARVAQGAHALAHHGREVRDAPARTRHRDALAGPDIGGYRRHLPPHRRDEILLGGARKLLAEPEDGRDVVRADPGVGVV